MKRVFVDANVMFSAVWREGSGILRLWELKDVQLVTSPYALLEAERNIQVKKPSAFERFVALVSKIEISHATVQLSQDYGLPAKDLPILEAAVGSGCVILLTGDITHFGHLIGIEAEGVMVMTVSAFLQTENS